MKVLSLILYVCASLMMAHVFVAILRKSECGVLVIASELLFISGICAYPIFYILDVVDVGKEGAAYLLLHPEPGVLTAFHVFTFCFGAFVGNTLAMRIPLRALSIRRVVHFSDVCVSSDRQWGMLLLFAVLGYLVFVASVGFSTALANAAAARGGDFDGFGEDGRWLFLKTLSNSFIYILVCAVPYLLCRGRWGLICLYFLTVFFAYLNSVSRNMILVFIISPWLVYLMRERHSMRLRDALSMMRPGFVVAALVVMVFGGFILSYTKSLGNFISGYYTGTDGWQFFEAKDGSGNVLSELLRNSEFQWFSTDAGINYAFDNSPPFLPNDVLWAPLGFVPGRVLDRLGLPDVKGVRPDSGLACVNSARFPGVTPCTIPPMWIGYSAYFFPVVGALLFGFLKFFLYARLSRLWRAVKLIDYRYVWVVYFLTLETVRLTSLIPSGVSSAVFLFLFIAGWFVVRRMPQWIRV